jgi:hypothetical protein
MENAADALQMAAFVLIFVLALTISINAFGEARQAAQIILDYQDREYDYTYVEDNGTTKRTVGVETIIPSIYKSYKENYKIVFNPDKIGKDEGLYKKNNTPIYSFDLENTTLDDNLKLDFITAILYGTSSITNETKNTLEKYLGITLNSEGLYDKIKSKKFVENLGIYYQEEIQGTDAVDANKTEKRVITYE